MLIPLIVACALSGEPAHWLLGASLTLLLPAMMLITNSIFQVMRTSIAAAENSAKLAEKMQTLARTDVVTSLANRAGLNHELVEIMMARNPKSKLALCWLDLDRFKEVNDTLGHPVGDRVLAEVARRLKETAHSDAIVALPVILMSSSGASCAKAMVGAKAAVDSMIAAARLLYMFPPKNRRTALTADGVNANAMPFPEYQAF